jgi:hypothetical protein
VTNPATRWGDGDDRRSVQGDFRHGYLEVTLRASGPTDAVMFLVFVVSRFTDGGDTYVLTSNLIAHAVEFLISTSVDALLGAFGAARPHLGSTDATTWECPVIARGQLLALDHGWGGVLRLSPDGEQPLFHGNPEPSARFDIGSIARHCEWTHA